MPTMPKRRILPPHFLALLALCLLAPPLTAQSDKSLQLLQRRYDDISVAFQRSMEEVAIECEANSSQTDAQHVRARSAPAELQTLDIDELPEAIQGDLPPALPPDQAWRVKLRKLELDYAIALYKLSRDALNVGHVSFAFDLVREVAFHDPDHKYARSLLGYKLVDGKWTTPFAARQEAAGKVYHTRYGWIPKLHKDKYEEGLRNVNGKWVSQEREASLRNDFKYAWEVESEHFHVKTNHSLEAGVQISEKLERFHQYFIREFAAFFNTPSQMRALFDTGQTSAQTRNPYDVNYFRERREYVQYLIASNPSIAISNGLYDPQSRVANFFFDPQLEGNFDAMYHEVTHQLLLESSSKVRAVGESAHFWVVEGFPCYLESFVESSEGPKVGNPGHPRFTLAQLNLARDNEYYEFRSFCSQGQKQFHQGGNAEILQKFYSQAACMVHFYLNYEDGLYRDALITHLSEIYSANNTVRAKAQGMDRLTGVSYEVLQQQYREYLSSITPPEVLAAASAEKK